MTYAPKGDRDYSVVRRGHDAAGDISHLSCLYCAGFSVTWTEKRRGGERSGSGTYNRMRAEMVKHFFAEHRDRIPVPPSETR